MDMGADSLGSKLTPDFNKLSPLGVENISLKKEEPAAAPKKIMTRSF
jgi:hypothetical protein